MHKYWEAEFLNIINSGELILKQILLLLSIAVVDTYTVFSINVFINLLCVSHMSKCTYNLQYTCEGQSTTCRSKFSPSTMLVLPAKLSYWPIKCFLYSIINALNAMSYLIFTQICK